MKTIVIASILLLNIVKMFGQPLHIVPIHLTNMDKDDILLTITSDTSEEFSFTIQDNTFYLNFSNGTVDEFQLGNRTILDLCNAVNSKYRGQITLSTDFPHIESTRIEITKKSTKIKQSLNATVKPSSIQPTVSIDFGLLLNLAQNDNSLNNSSLLTQTGFNLDIIGQHKFLYDDKSQLNVALRLGFASNNNFIINDSVAVQSSNGQLESAIKQANQAVISGHFEYIPKNQVNNKNGFNFGIYSEFGWAYSRPNPLDLSSTRFRIKDNYINIIDSFSLKSIQNVKEQSKRIFHLGHVELGLNFKFIKDNNLVFYGGIGGLLRPNIQRGFRFSRTDKGEIDPETLNYSVHDLGLVFRIRPKIGIRLANILDIRAESIYSINRFDPDNLFRILITRDFPLKTK